MHRRSSNEKKVSLLLILIGFVGALLQFSEFKGIHEGIEPAVVTSIMFSFPIWILAFSVFKRDRNVGIFEIFQAIFAFAGVLLIAFPNGSRLQFSLSLIFPMLASFSIALWITISNHLRKNGVHTLKLSATYDFFSFVALIGIFGNDLFKDFSEFSSWAQSPSHFYGLMAFSVFVGLIPNFLFYFGSRKVTPHLVGTAMALEPIFSSLYSALLFQTQFSWVFFLGGAFILFANLPKEVWLVFRSRFGKSKSLNF